MLDTKKVGIKIAVLRKNLGLSQEKLAEMICISPQAISKWENGHTLPETVLLPVLSQIFGCTIDEIIMPAYSFDERIEVEKPTALEQQAKYIAKYVTENLEGKIMPAETAGLDDNVILNSICKAGENLQNLSRGSVARGKPIKNDGIIGTAITVSTPEKELKLVERIYCKNDTELQRYHFMSRYISAIPRVYHIDFNKKAILLEDLSNSGVPGFYYDEAGQYGDMIRGHYADIISAVAKLHAGFWENAGAFEQIGLEWRLQSKENLLAHISAMEQDYLKYRKNEGAGKIPKVWDVFENTIETEQLNHFNDAIQYLKDQYINLVDSRFHTGKNITVIHGDLHPGQIYISKSADKNIKFTGLQAVRMGLCTEDLAMLIALHIEPDKKYAQPLLDRYYQCLCEKIKDYPYETFLDDYKIAVAENMFFTVRLINGGIYDFKMRDKAIKAFETFVLESE